MGDKRYCVYLHRDNHGDVRYVGSGNYKRPYSCGNRNKEHLDILSNLIVEIVKDNLSKVAAVDLETELYDKYVITGLLVNKIRPCKVKRIDYDLISKYLEYDETSPSCLRWKKEVSDGYSKRLPRGKPAGTIKKSIDYYVVKIAGIKYFAHRLVVVLNDGVDIEENLVVDHIDRNKLNNKIDNLVTTTQQKNVLNRDLDNSVRSYGYIARKNSRNISGVIGVYWDKSESVWVSTYTDSDGCYKEKTFNPRKICGTAPTDIANYNAFLAACEFRKEFEMSLQVTV